MKLLIELDDKTINELDFLVDIFTLVSRQECIKLLIHKQYDYVK